MQADTPAPSMEALAAAARRGGVKAACTNASFHDWWEHEGRALLLRLSETDGSIMLKLKLLAEMAWTQGALCSAQLDRDEQVPPEVPL